MEALADELLTEGNLDQALQRITRWGLRAGGAAELPGIQQLLQDLRNRRQAELERYDLNSALDDVRARVDRIVRTERAGIEQRRRELGTDPGLGEMFESIAQRKRQFLDDVGADPATAVTNLADYEFLDDQAREQFGALEQMLERHVLDRHFRSMEASLRGLAGEELENFKSMLHDLNDLLRDEAEGGAPDFEAFRQQHGRHFPGVSSVDGLIEKLRQQETQTEALMASMSAEMRRPLEDMMNSVLSDHVLRDELAAITEVLERFARPGKVREYPFSGRETVSLDEALHLMRHMHAIDRLEDGLLAAHESGTLRAIDDHEVLRLIGPEAHRAVSRLRDLAGVLESSGYAARNGEQLELTARGIRKIGQKALQDVFSHLKGDAFGGHHVAEIGFGGEQSDVSRPYEFGDAFLLDLHATMMNAVERSGARGALSLQLADFEVFETERLTQASTVLMLDMSRSMPLRGCFVAAKKVALALHNLIRAQFPRDELYIVGFSDYARQLQPETLHQVSWGDYVYGTNMQHGLMLARRLLGRHHTGSRQIILITDGEPTAHFEGGRVQFAYPPTFRTFQETLREVKRCTQDGIVINTFMLDRSHYLTDFVAQMTRVNHGRAFFATPERLGDYILVDYVRSRTSRAS